LHVFRLPRGGNQPDFVFLPEFNFYKRQKMKNDVFYQKEGQIPLIFIKKTIKKKVKKVRKSAMLNPLCGVF